VVDADSFSIGRISAAYSGYPRQPDDRNCIRLAYGQWLAYDSNINGNQDIFKMPVAGGEPQQLTRNMGDNFNPTWSPDGKGDRVSQSRERKP
jgi:hypothetical protein